MTDPQPTDLAPLLNELFAGATLDRERARATIGALMDGRVSTVQAAALLAALRTRGETVEEITGFAEAMRERSVAVPYRGEAPLLDTCGTGGTGLSTINISTTALFVAAADGVRVAKHGNRGVTKRSGSADLLEALGARIDLPPERLSEALDEVGVAFLFARAHHPAMRFVAPIRAELRARTVFNVLGPLTNPAGADRQLMGVYAPEMTETLAQVLAGLGSRRALVVHGDGIDDFSVSGATEVSELHPSGVVETYRVEPEQVGLARSPRDELAGGDAEANARDTRAILGGELHGAKRDIVLFNAGAVLYLADRADDLAAGVARAGALLDSGAAAAKLEAYLAFTQR
jgi:anthranilate phosphoribosyltransferase